MPVVVEAELRLMALQRQWQQAKLAKLDQLVRRLENERCQRISAARAMRLRHGMPVGDLQAAQAIRKGAEPIGPRFPPGTRQFEQTSGTGSGWSFVLGACKAPAQDFFN